MTSEGQHLTSRWVKAWPDALAFGGGLAIAWFAQWETTDLVWSLWLSSLVVGYSTIIWIATRSLREFAIGARSSEPAQEMKGKSIGGSFLLAGALFLIGFFTIHFCGFHFIHSVFLNSFYPVLADTKGHSGFPGIDTYVQVFQRYWIFLPAAFIAERAGFRDKPRSIDAGDVTPQAIAKRKLNHATESDMMAPYKNVIRMHLLIFFFAGVSLVKLDSFLVYAVVYAAYFFPWRLLKKETKVT